MTHRYRPSPKLPSADHRWSRRAALWIPAAAVILLCRTPNSNADGQAGKPAYEIIVHPGNPASELDRSFVTEAFLKKIRKWPNGSIIRPVDLRQDSPVRRRFSAEVLGRSVEAVRSHWQQMIFSGRDLPPPELRSSDEVVAYVIRTPGALGYVSPDTPLRGAKIVQLIR